MAKGKNARAALRAAIESVAPSVPDGSALAMVLQAARERLAAMEKSAETNRRAYVGTIRGARRVWKCANASCAKRAKRAKRVAARAATSQSAGA